MRLIFINRFYWPDTPATGQLLTDLAANLVAGGYDVTVITSAAHDSPFGTETRGGVHVCRLRSARWAHRTILGKALAFGMFSLRATWEMLRRARRDDLLVPMTDPPLLGIAAWFVAKVRGARVLHWIQDIYPEVAMAVTGRQSLAVMRPIRNASWRAADGCVALSAEMAAVVAAAGVDPNRIHVAPNWAPNGLSRVPADDPAVAALRAEWALSDRFIVAYSGNLGRVHDLDTVVGAAVALRQNPKIVFLFVGDGPRRAMVESEVARQKLTNVVFRPPQPRDRLPTSLAVGDVHLVTLQPGCERYVFPSKLYGVLAVGRPVIVVGPPQCELARLVSDLKIGWAVENGRFQELADAISALAAGTIEVRKIGARAAAFAESHGAVAGLARWRSLLADGLRLPVGEAMDTSRASG